MKKSLHLFVWETNMFFIINLIFLCVTGLQRKQWVDWHGRSFNPEPAIPPSSSTGVRICQTLILHVCIMKCPFSLYNSLYCQPIALDMNYILCSKFYRRRIFYKFLRNRFKNATYLLGFYTMYTFVRTIQINSSFCMEFTHLLSVVLVILVYGTFIF